MPPKKKKEPEKAPVDEVRLCNSPNRLPLEFVYHSLQSFQPVDISTREPRTVMLMLESPEPAVVVKALQALHQHMQKCT